MPREKGSTNRNFPALPLAEALLVSRVIQDKASGMPVSKLTLAEYLDTTPSSSVFRELVMSSRGYGLTEGGANAEEFALTPTGDAATGGDEVAQVNAYKHAVMNVPPYKTFFDAYSGGKKFPATPSLREFLSKHAHVADDRLDECAGRLSSDAAFAGLTRNMKGTLYVDLEGAPLPAVDAALAEGEAGEDEHSNGHDGGDTLETALLSIRDTGDQTPHHSTNGKPKKVFIAHGKNHTPLDQLKSALNQFQSSVRRRDQRGERWAPHQQESREPHA
jgi:hypothetical protein